MGIKSPFLNNRTKIYFVPFLSAKIRKSILFNMQKCAFCDAKLLQFSATKLLSFVLDCHFFQIDTKNPCDLIRSQGYEKKSI